MPRATMPHDATDDGVQLFGTEEDRLSCAHDPVCLFGLGENPTKS